MHAYISLLTKPHLDSVFINIKIHLIFINFLIAKRHIYESCDQYTQCEKNSKCMSSGYGRTCQCSSGYEEIDGHCVKGKH